MLARVGHIGQPVGIPRASGETVGALRLAVDARMISECWFAGPDTDAMVRFQASLEGLQVVFDKLTLMLAPMSRQSGTQWRRETQAAGRPLNLQPQDLKKS